MTSCLLSWATKSFLMRSTLRGKNLLQVSNFFPSRMSSIEKGDRNKNAEIISLKVYIFTLNLFHSEWPNLHIDIGTF